MLPLFVSPDDVSWAMFSRPFWSDFNEALRKSSVFHDAPWNYLYPFYDQMIPRNHSKFILLLRDSTRDLVNSNMKMYVRGRKKREKIPPEVQYDFTNWTLSPKPSGVSQGSWKDFWMITARGYEMHNQNVMDYFRAKGRLDDLLVLNLMEESKKMPFSEQWFKITQFLGCPNVTEKGLPHANTAQTSELKNHVKQMDFFPSNFVIHWQHHTFPHDMQKIVNAVKDMNGTFDALMWERLNQSYGHLFFDKKQ